MIESKKDLHFYLSEDKRANLGGNRISPLSFCIRVVYGDNAICAYRWCWALRHYEYYINQGSFVRKNIWKFIWHKLSVRYNISCPPNVVDYGLKIDHICGGGIVIVANHIGKHFSIRQFTTIGKGNGDTKPTIGDNVMLGANVVVIGDIVVGNNVIIGAGAVVVKDVPENSVVVGNPGHVINKK